jgi:hypothetical protein
MIDDVVVGFRRFARFHTYADIYMPVSTKPTAYGQMFVVGLSLENDSAGRFAGVHF